MFIGDSITAGGHWHDMFSDDVRIANRGIGGETIAEIALRLNEITALKPKKIFIMAGINDIYRSAEVGDILDSFKFVVENLIRDNPSSQVFLQSTLECEEEVCGYRRLNSIRQINVELEKIACSFKRCHFIDLNAKMANSNGLKSALSKDGIHINTDGYVIWREILTPYINSN